MDRAERRHRDWSKAIRKRDIIQHYGFDLYDNLHQYSKNKIHCSCDMCSRKTNNKARKHVWDPVMDWKMCDLRRIEEMRDEENDYWEGGDFTAG